MLTIDRGDSHYEDAGGWVEACFHIGLFLRWAARRGLAATRHTTQMDRLVLAPGAYVMQACDGKLLPDDFASDESLIRTLYGIYLPHYARSVREATGSQYVAGLDDAVLSGIERFLDRELRRLRPDAKPSVRPTTVAAPAARRRVRHPKFGEGEVVETRTEGGRTRLTVEFDAGRKTLLASFVEDIEPAGC